MKKRNVTSVLSLLLAAFILAAAPLAAASAPAEKDVKNITKKVFPSVVRVEARSHVRKVASGVVVDREGHIITTALITPREEKIFVVTQDGKKLDAEFLGADAETHLAVIKIKKGQLPALDIADAKELEAGSWIGVVSISPENKPVITQGIVSSIADEALRLNVWVVRGASGSPVVDEKGRMVGLLRGAFVDEGPAVSRFKEGDVEGLRYWFSRGEAPSSGLAMAIPSDTVKDVFLQIKEKGKVERGWMGVSIALNEEGKVEILDVEKESPAELAKLEKGDIVVSYDGSKVTSTEWLAKAIRKNKPGETVKLKILRDGEEQSVEVRLGEYTQLSLITEFERKFPRLYSPDAKILRDIFPRPFEPQGGLRRKAPEIYRWVLGERKYIGVYIQALSEELANFFGSKNGLGVLIGRVDVDSPAAEAGLSVGDVVVRADGKDIRSVDDLMTIIQKKKKGESISLDIIRDKRPMTVVVKVEEDKTPPGPEFSQFFGDWGRLQNQMNNEINTYPNGKDSGDEEQKDRPEKSGEVIKKKKENQGQDFFTLVTETKNRGIRV
jgi:serine protease Do